MIFQHDMGNDDFNDLARKNAFEKVLRNKVFNVVNNSKHDRNKKTCFNGL